MFVFAFWLLINLNIQASSCTSPWHWTASSDQDQDSPAGGAPREQSLNVEFDPLSCTYALKLGEITALESIPFRLLHDGHWRLLTCGNVHANSPSGWVVDLEGSDGPIMRFSATVFEEFVELEVLALREIRPNSAFDNTFATFPGFKETTFLDGRLTWKGSFVQPSFDGCSSGTQGGPCVLFDRQNEAHGNVLILSTANEFTIASRDAGNGVLWNGGISGTIRLIPKGFRQQFIIFSGSDGVTDTIARWGEALQKRFQKKMQDITISTLSYQTDNGAQYCFGCRSKCDHTLLDELNSLRSASIPVKFLSFQLPWWPSSGSAPWCVSSWDWNPSKIPMGVPQFHKQAGISFQLYAPYFCTNTKFQKDFDFLESDETLPTCKDFHFLEIEPKQSLEFYGKLFDLGISYGMTSFEADFMNQNLNCVPDFLHTIGRSELYLDGMVEAASQRNISIQWCYASPNAVLQALKYPPVTSFRASFDFAYGGSWDIGVSSLLLWAMRTAPSKDTFWTSDNGDQATALGACDKVHGCPEDHGDVGCELHTALAVFSTGPVGFGDAINETNAKRIMKTCRLDGTLLQPNKPATAMDGFLLREKNPHIVLQTFSMVSKMTFYFVLGHHLHESSTKIHLANLWPRAQYQCSFVVSSADGQLTIVSSDSSIELSGLQTKFNMKLLLVSPICDNSQISFLGEQDKFVSVSRNRFDLISCETTDSMAIIVKGTPSEEVHLSFAITGANWRSIRVAEISVTFGPNEFTKHVKFSKMFGYEESLVA